jgi:hypothetical protein
MESLDGCCKGMTEEEFAAFIADKLQTDSDNRFPEFFTTIQFYAEDLTGKSTHSG